MTPGEPTPITQLTTPCSRCGSNSLLVQGFCAQCLATTAFSKAAPGDEALELGFIDEFEPELLPKQLGRYTLIEELGRGGMGVVYSAKQEGLDRLVALKIIQVGPLTDPEFLSRFRSEARLAARLQHPHIVSIYEVGESKGYAYFSMDLVPGGTLAQRVRDKGPVSPQEAATLTKQLASALSHAHALEILHRDLKPANILLDYDGEPKIADFGLAKAADDVSLTMSRQMLGTPAWQAPEALTDARLATTASDIYGLGAILYFSLTGHPPFPGATVTEVMAQIEKEDPISLRQLNQRVPADLETIVLRCLEKESSRRFASATDLEAELARFLEGNPILSRPIGPLNLLRRWAKRNRALSVALGLLLLVCVGSSVALWSLWRSAVAAAQAEKTQRKKTQLELWNTQLQTARGERLKSDADARSRVLKIVSDASRYKVSREVRDEAIAALAMPEMIVTGEIYQPRNMAAVPRALSLHPHERKAVFGRSDGSFAQVDFGKPLERLEFEHQATTGARIAKYSASGHYLALHHEQGVNLWETATGRAIAWKLPFTEACLDFCTTNDDKIGACGLADSFVLVSLPDGLERSRIDCSIDTWYVNSLSPLGRWFAVGLKVGDSNSSDFDRHRLKLYEDLEKPRCSRDIDLPSIPTALAWSPDESVVAVAMGSGEIRVYLASTGREMAILRGHEHRVVELRFLSDGRHLVSSGWDRSLRVWDVATQHQLLTLPLSGNFTFVDDEAALLIQTSYEHVTEAKLRLPFLARILVPSFQSESSDASAAASVTADGKYVVKPGRQETHIWDRATGRLLSSGLGCSSFMPSLTSSEAFAATPFGLFQASIIDGKLEAITSWGDQRRNNHAALSADGSTIAVTTERMSPQANSCSTIEIWRARQRIAKWDSGAFFPSIAISGDGSLVATGGHQDCQLALWQSATGQPIALEASPAQLRSDGGMDVALNRSGTLLVSITPKALRLWDVATRRLIREIPRLGLNFGMSAAFSANERLLAASGEGASLWLLDPRTLDRIATLEFPSNQPTSVKFSPDGQTLVASVPGSGVLVWNLAMLQQELTALGLNWE